MAPRFSILTPVYETPADVLMSMLASVRAQTVTDWELCLVDDGSKQRHVRSVLDKARRKDRRIKVAYRESNGGIVAASNDALAMAEGDFVALLDHDDELHPEALSHVNHVVATRPEVDYIYTDEDKIDRDGRHFQPFFKPDWSPERLRTQMYTCHLSVLRRALVNEVGGFDASVEGSQDWDLVLKVTERARAVAHVPTILYHWRALDTSAAGGGNEAKPWAYEAAIRAIQAHCGRTGFPARVEQDETDPGIYHLRPALERRPPVSIIIPTRGQSREVRCEPTVLVTHCVRSIVTRSSYDNYEIVCVIDESTPPAVVSELREIAGDRLRLVGYDRPFSFSSKINIGALRSEGEQLLLLNDDIEVVTDDWIDRLVMYADRPGIGAVGCRLHYEDGRLQHAGVLFYEGKPGHLYRGFSGDFRGYFGNVLLAQNYLAVTGACLMTPRDLFLEVGGLSTTLPINFNDIDYCLKVRDAGQRVVYDPDAVLYHFESSSRSPQVEEWEIERLVGRWLHCSRHDPHSNPGFHFESFHMVPRMQLSDGSFA